MKTIPFLLLLILPLCAQQLAAGQEQAEKPEYIRVEEDEAAARLQTTVTTLEKDGVSVGAARAAQHHLQAIHAIHPRENLTQKRTVSHKKV
jgi:hypothetical protein